LSRVAASEAPAPDEISARNAVIVIVVGIMATTLAQPDVLAVIPLKNLLKNVLRLDRSANSAFFFWIGLPWYIKPLAGIVTDAFPLFGRRRSSYLITACALAVAAWTVLAFVAHSYGPLFWGCMALSAFMMLAGTVVGAVIVETAQATSESGRITAIRMFVSRACGLVAAPAAGYLAAIAFHWTAAICAAVMFLPIPATLLFMREPRRDIPTAEILAGAGRQLRRLASAQTMWIAVGLTALFYIAPGFGTALFYKQQNELHMSTIDQGWLGLIGAVAGMASAALYAGVCHRYSLRRLMLGGLTVSAFVTLTYLFYDSLAAARTIAVLDGFCGGFAEITLMDLALRATPKGSEGLGYALIISVRNLVVFGTDWLGSMMLDSWHFTFNSLVVINAATTLVTAPVVLLIPAALVAARDREGAG
jgi:MFS family permease